eukprot:Skav217248  [mRNA]  locus=scaffold110:333276:335795:- [translate_table: standard]
MTMPNAVEESNGLVHGRCQLALRVTEGDPRIVRKPALWRAETIPPGWSPQQVESFCAQAGFSEIELIAKNWRRNGSSRLVKAMSDNLEDTMSVAVALDGDAEYEVTFAKEAKRRQHCATKPLSRERSIKLRHRQPVSHAVPASHTTAVVMDEEPTGGEEDTATDSAMGAVGAAKRPPTRNEAASSKRKCWRGWLPDGAKRVDNQGKGDCLFLAIAVALNNVMSHKNYSGSQVRLFLRSFMLQHHLEYEALWDRHRAGTDSPAPDEYTFQDYLSDIKRAGTWGGYLGCYAAASALKRTVYLVDDTGEVAAFPFEGPKSQHPIALYYIGSHFETLTGPPGMWDQLMLYSQKHQVQRKGCLGGGKRSSHPSCRLTDCSVPSVKNQSLKHSKQSAQAKSARSLALTDFASRKRTPCASPKLSDFASSARPSKSAKTVVPSLKVTQFASSVPTKRTLSKWCQAEGPAPWNKGQIVKRGKHAPAFVALQESCSNGNATNANESWKPVTQQSLVHFAGTKENGVGLSPLSKCPSHLRGLFVKAGSLNGTYNAIQHALKCNPLPEVLGFAECRANDKEQQSLIAYLQRKGYRAWVQGTGAKRSQRNVEYSIGGMCIAIRQDVRGFLIDSLLREEGEAMLLNIGSAHLGFA